MKHGKNKYNFSLVLFSADPMCKVLGVLRELQIITIFGYSNKLVKVIRIFFPCPVIGHEARGEWIAAFITIDTVAN